MSTTHTSMQNSDQQFIDLVWQNYRTKGRIFSWRQDTEPYKVFISEVMLQQTQTGRVAEKFPVFLSRFPDFESLARADLSDVLIAWQGLGYNRRGRFLREAAQKIVDSHDARLPADQNLLMDLPGIGYNTASSIMAFAFNIPTVFIETNIRAVFIHHFFPDEVEVHDKMLLPIVERCLDRKNPREWYWALMDYGVLLKKTTKNPSRKSAHHTTQSRFEGSVRQIRGSLLRAMLKTEKNTVVDKQTLADLSRRELYPASDSPENFSTLYEKALAAMVSEGVIVVSENVEGDSVYKLSS